MRILPTETDPSITESNILVEGLYHQLGITVQTQKLYAHAYSMCEVNINTT